MNATKRISAVTAGAAVVLIVIWYMALFRPQSHHLTSAHKAYASAEAQINQLQQQADRLEALERQIPADNAKLSTLNSAVPSTPDLKDVLDQLHGLATSTGCQLTAVNPATPTTSGTATAGPQSLQTTMTVTGSYPQLMSFMTGLTRIPRTVVVDSVSIGSASGGLQAQLTTRIFYTP